MDREIYGYPALATHIGTRPGMADRSGAIDGMLKGRKFPRSLLQIEGGIIMMKRSCVLLWLWVLSGAICANPTDSCAGLEGSASIQCRSNEQTLRQQQLERQLQQQEDRQNQLDKQQREVQDKLESMRLQNEILRTQLQREAAANQPVLPVATDDSKNREIKSWRTANPWYGTDYVKTAFAVRYVNQLQQERPDLTGRPLLDALSAKVDETFGAKH